MNDLEFDQSDNSNANHPLRFYYEAAKTTAFTTNVTTNGTPGNSGAYTQIVIGDATPSMLHYQCSAHANMGNAVRIGTRNLTGFTTDDLTEGSTNKYNTDVVADTTPQLGGALDVNGQKIVSVSNGNIDIEPHGTGDVLLGNFKFDADQSVGSGQDNYVLTYDHSTGKISLEASAGGGGGSSITVQDEGSSLSTAATTINFVGNGVVASGSGATKLIISIVLLFGFASPCICQIISNLGTLLPKINSPISVSSIQMCILYLGQLINSISWVL